MYTILRNGSILYGPRLLLALIVVTTFFFLLNRPSSLPISVGSGSGSGAGSHFGKPPVDGSLEHASKQPDVLGDKLFDYLKDHVPESLRPNPRPDGPDKIPEKSGSAGNSGSLIVDKAPAPKADFEADLKGQDPSNGKDPLCDHQEDIKDILVVVRGHAHEMFSGNVSTLLSTLKCVDHLLFSTVAHDFGEGQGVSIDALANVTESIKKEKKEFELYRKIAEAAKAGNVDPEAIKEDQDHNLGKFTMIPTVLEAYERYPKKKWFMFVEAKTYVSIPNLIAWTSKMNSEHSVFAGAQVMIGDVELPHSGSGILMSAAALEKLKLQNEIKKAKWEEMVSNSCCGDKILAEALKDAGVGLNKAFPITQGETPFTLDWSKRHWCKAAVTWHGIEPENVRVLHNLDRKWYDKNQGIFEGQASPAQKSLKQTPPLRYGQAFKALLLPTIRDQQNRTGWDNLASTFTYTDENKGQYAQYSENACRAACDVRTECLQYAFEPGKCRLGTVVRFGHKAERSDMNSGWVIKRVELWVKAQDRMCQQEGISAWELF